MQDATGHDRTVSCHLPTPTLLSRESEPTCNQDRASGGTSALLDKKNRFILSAGQIESHSGALSRLLRNQNAVVKRPCRDVQRRHKKVRS